MAEPTLFEKILSGEIPGNFICRGDGWGSFLDVFPRSEGHTLVVLENPSQRLNDLSQQELGLLFSGVKETKRDCLLISIQPISRLQYTTGH